MLFGFPAEVKRVDGDAVAAEAGAGVEGHKTKGLGFGGFDDFPNVDAQFVINDFHFVHEGDVYAAENIFQKLGGFGGAAAGNRHKRFDCDAVNGFGFFQTRRSVAPR